MATIRKRGDYQYQVQIRRKGYPLLTKTFATRSDAEKWTRAIERELDLGSYVPRKEAENTALKEALDRYEREVVVHKKGAKQECARIRLWKRHPLASRFLATIRGSDIASYRDERMGEVAPNTVRHELAILSHLFTIAIKEWGMGSLVNPVQQIRMPKMPPGRDRRLNPGELDRIIVATESVVLGNIIRFALETAMRQAEIAGMIWNMVDLKKKIAVLPETKNGEKRIVPLSMEAVRILEGLVRPINGKVWGITPHGICAAFRRAVFRARAVYEKECKGKKQELDPEFLVDLTFHDLRHEATSRFFEKGLNVMEVTAITRHKTLQMLKRYTHLKAEDLLERLK